MLSDFGDFKQLLSIVNKSFVTVNKPLKIYESRVFIRDTILLAPTGMGSLDQIGSIYKLEVDYKKLSV